MRFTILNEDIMLDWKTGSRSHKKQVHFVEYAHEEDEAPMVDALAIINNQPYDEWIVLDVSECHSYPSVKVANSKKYYIDRIFNITVECIATGEHEQYYITKRELVNNND